MLKVSDEGDKIILTLKGKFTFGLQGEFREAYSQFSNKSFFVIDLSQVDYMDSSALGMLLILLEYVGKDRKRLVLTGCRGETKKILNIVEFHKLMTIE